MKTKSKNQLLIEYEKYAKLLRQGKETLEIRNRYEEAKKKYNDYVDQYVKENFNNDDKIELIEFAEALFHRLIQAENVFSDLSDSSSLFEKRYKYNTLYRWD